MANKLVYDPDEVIQMKTEYTRICTHVGPQLTSVIFGMYVGYQKIRETWTYEEVLEELQDLINNKSNIKKERR